MDKNHNVNNYEVYMVKQSQQNKQFWSETQIVGNDESSFSNSLLKDHNHAEFYILYSVCWYRIGLFSYMTFPFIGNTKLYSQSHHHVYRQTGLYLFMTTMWKLHNPMANNVLSNGT